MVSTSENELGEAVGLAFSRLFWEKRGSVFFEKADFNFHAVVSGGFSNYFEANDAIITLPAFQQR